MYPTIKNSGIEVPENQTLVLMLGTKSKWAEDAASGGYYVVLYDPKIEGASVTKSKNWDGGTLMKLGRPVEDSMGGLQYMFARGRTFDRVLIQGDVGDLAFESLALLSPNVLEHGRTSITRIPTL